MADLQTKQNNGVKLCRKFEIRLKHPNPLFENWLEEWLNDAVNKNLVIQHTFRKALHSLRKYPLPLPNGRSCSILDHFGQELCHKLDTKLIEYQMQHPKADLNVSQALDVVVNLRKSPRKSNHNNVALSQTAVEQSSTGSGALSKKKKDYVPFVGTGPYALLVTLHDNQCLSGTSEKVSMSKKELIDKAQVLCDSSFKKPVPGSRYTAWSSMSQLCRKHLVIKFGCSAKYFLTDEGMALAEKCKNAASEINSTVDDALRTTIPMNENNLDDDDDDSSDDFPLTQKYLSRFSNYRKPNTASSRPVHAFSSSDGESVSDSSDDEEENQNTNVQNNKGTSNQTMFYSSQNPNKKLKLHDELASTIETIHRLSQNYIANHKAELARTSAEIPSPYEFSTATQSASQNTLKLTQSSENSSAPSQTEPFEMLPYDYQLILLIDNAEMAGKVGGDASTQILLNMNVDCEVRHLNVGDYVWICRHYTTRNELILPYIIERKRIDDLAKSIKDGRFHEQKFRLKSMPVKQRIYVVEGHGNSHLVLPITTLMQAACNTQVVDNFIVKHTTNYLDTLKYLASLHHKFQDLIWGKRLASCVVNELPPFNWTNHVYELLTFNDFMKNAQKKKKFTVREMFIRHLVQLYGLSVDRAVAIVDKYPTPQHLRQMYANGQGEDVIGKVKFGPLQHSVGSYISKSIHSLYTMDKFS